MRFAFALVLAAPLTSCIGGSGAEPKWPKPHASETDGGESLAPHVAGATAIVAATGDDKPAVVATPEATPTAVTPAATTTTPAATPTTEEPIQTEEIIIEVDD